jgi:hypothetical protein
MRLSHVATLTAVAGFLTVALAVSEAEAGNINLATGLDAAGNLQTANDSIDAFWKAAGGNTPIMLPNAYVVGPGSADDGTCCGWPANGPNSAWIAVDPDSVSGNGDMSFTRTFWVNTPGTASISGGLWSIDDNGTLVLNGTTISSLSAPDYDFLNPTGTGAGDFVHGWNTLTMIGTGSDNFYEAARLQGSVVGAGVPEPSTWAMMLIGFVGLGYAGYRLGAKARPAIA